MVFLTADGELVPDPSQGCPGGFIHAVTITSHHLSFLESRHNASLLAVWLLAPYTDIDCHPQRSIVVRRPHFSLRKPHGDMPVPGSKVLLN
jgi:hypothetical protein